MKGIYSSPLRVYLVLGLLALVGIYCGLQLPVSLFPNSTKPKIVYGIPYGNLTNDEFLHTYGKELESKIAGIDTGDLKVVDVEAKYNSGYVHIAVEFEWGSEPKAAANELNNTVMSYIAQLPEESRDGLWNWVNKENAGFFAVSFFSAERDLDSLYDIIEPAFRAKIGKVKDAEEAVIYNPSRKEIRVELIPEAMAALQLFPKDIHSALSNVLSSYQGGSVTMGVQRLQVQMPRTVKAVEDLGKVSIASPSGQAVHLSDIARIDYAPSSVWTRSFKTNGADSLILFGTPVSGGNIKRMSEEFLQIVDETLPSLPKDIQHRVLVDPSEFIRNSINNVLHEVILAALIATAILFFFIGSARNVLTAAIEIPLSMVLAFILMRIFDMNLNLISLGGLALSAGMNVDASVVVMENIFRHFKMAKGPLDFSSKLEIIVQAVKEVRLPVIAATIASLVVFIPLAFTSQLTNAILGDLAKAVVFSHGFSAIVALILVPTIRLQLMRHEKEEEKKHSRIQSGIQKFENMYANALSKFLESKKIKRGVYVGLVSLLAILLAFVLPSLPKEIVGKPDTDWMILGIRTKGNTLNTQMESQALETERELLQKFGHRISYTFNQISGANRANLMARLKDKKDMQQMWKDLEAHFTNTPITRYWVEPWNPSELEIPNPPHMEINVRGGDYTDQVEVAREINDLLKENKVFDRIHTEPNIHRDKGIVLTPHLEQWSQLQKNGTRVTPSDLSDLVRVATSGRRVGYLPIKDERMPIFLRYPMNLVTTPEQVEGLPIGVGKKIIPLKALATVNMERVSPILYREDEQGLVQIKGRTDKGQEHTADASLEKAKAIVNKWKAEKGSEHSSSVVFEDPAEELTQALDQLAVAVSLSIVLIFFTLLLQFGSVATVLLILVSVPLGFIGVLGALFIFGSTLSLNSVLGVILLNGIAVANSILLVDFIRKRVDSGMSPRTAAVEAGRKRMRPILITSLTTVLGMLPIAMGLGDGGRILQPLGITVSAGLWVSTILTLFLVPALQVSYLEWQSSSTRFAWLGRIFGSIRIPSFPKIKRAEGAAAKSLIQSWWIIALFSLMSVSGLSAEKTEKKIEKKADSKALSFTEAIDKIVGRSTSVGEQEANLKATRARNVPTDLIYLPSISVSGEYDRGRRFVGGTETTSRGINANASLNIFKFGADAAAQNRAEAQESQQEFLIEDSVLDSQGEAVRGLVNLIRAHQEEDIRRRSVAIRNAALKIAGQRFKKGLLAKQEVDKVQIEHDNALATLRDAEANTISARAQVTALLGHANVDLNWPWKTLLEKSAVLKSDNTSLSSRPDWQAAKKRVEAAHYSSKENFGKIFPSLDLNGSYGYSDNVTTNTKGDTWSAGLTLTIPLFDKLSKVSDYREQVYLKAASEYGLEQTRRTARQEWEGAKASFEIALETAKVREKTVKLSEKLYQTNLRRFNRGLVNVNDLILDQDRLFNSELLAVSGWGNAHLRFSDLCRSLGKKLTDCLKP